MLRRKVFEICTCQIAGKMQRRVRYFVCFKLLAKRAHVIMGQPELPYRPTIHVLTGESPEETRKLVAYEQIIVEHWPKLSASEGTNSEFMSSSESLKGRVAFEKSANA